MEAGDRAPTPAAEAAAAAECPAQQGGRQEQDLVISDTFRNTKRAGTAL